MERSLKAKKASILTLQACGDFLQQFPRIYDSGLPPLFGKVLLITRNQVIGL
jgi:hypothetical protein